MLLALRRLWTFGKEQRIVGGGGRTFAAWQWRKLKHEVQPERGTILNLCRVMENDAAHKLERKNFMARISGGGAAP